MSTNVSAVRASRAGIAGIAVALQRFAADERIRWAAYAAVVTALVLWAARLLYGGLGLWNLQDWDEGRHIGNAVEMYRRGGWLVNTWLGSPDYYNLKPPLSMDAIALSFHVLGLNPLAARLPSMVATIAVVVIVGLYVLRLAGRVASVITVAATISTPQLIDGHSGRTADPDALFILFMTVGVLATLSARTRPWLLVVTTTAFSLAFLTKSWHSVLLLVFASAMLLWHRRTFRGGRRHLLVATAGFLPVLAWAAARFTADGTRFFGGMVQYDLLARSSEPLEGHSGTALTYVQLLQTWAGPWVAVGLAAGLLILALRPVALGEMLRPRGLTADLLSLTAWVLLVFGAFSLVQTKLGWYTHSALPALWIVVGVLVSKAVQRTGTAPRTVIGMASGLALILCLSSIDTLRATEGTNATQAAMAALKDVRGTAGQQAFIDPSAGFWSQGNVAAAEMAAALRPEDGAVDGFISTGAKGSLLVLQDGSEADMQLRQSGVRVRAVAHEGTVSIFSKE